MKKLLTITTTLFLLLAFGWFLNQPEKVHQIEVSTTPESNFRKLASKVTSKPQEATPKSLLPVLEKQIVKSYKSGKEKVNDLSTTFKKTKKKKESLKTREFRLKGQRIFISTDYSAIPKSEYSGSRDIASINDHVIIKGTSGLPVVQDPVKLIKGIATGHIIVSVKPDVDLTELAQKHKLSVHHAIPHLNLISFVPQTPGQLLETSVSLSESPLLDSVRLDISYGGPREK